MQAGILFCVVGPSGCGKDTLIDGARIILESSSEFTFARRVITRAADAGGEAHDSLSESEFAAKEASGAFLITWDAHGLRYGIRANVSERLHSGTNVIANVSRATIGELILRVPRLLVIEIWAPDEVRAARILARGREDGEAVMERVKRRAPPFPQGVAVIRVANDRSPEDGIRNFVGALKEASARFRLKRVPLDLNRRALALLPADSTVVRAPNYAGFGRIELEGAEGRNIVADVALVDAGSNLLQPDEIGLSSGAFAQIGLEEGSHVVIRRTPAPSSRDALRRKVRGAELGEAEFAAVIGDIVAGRYTESEVAGFLVAANRNLTDDEVIHLARVRARYATAMKWNHPIVVDKHSMGGIPGSRITMIVVPIVAAHGLPMPKTSSRAITSAAGTADAMETLARVDLDVAGVRRTVESAGGCIAWNGRLTQSSLDDVMNAITRPLGLESARWSVASILSKKLAAGSTHVLIDLPWGPGARMADEEEASVLGALFERVGSELGLRVKAVPTDGRAPIGRGIGPALEVRDVLQVLRCDPRAPQDLREKAIRFSADLIAWDPAVSDPAEGRRRAEELLVSGAALQALERIVDAQGRRSDPVTPSTMTEVVRSDSSGIVVGINGFAVGGIARRAGAPIDGSAGVDLVASVGDQVKPGDALLIIHSSVQSDLAAASAMAASRSGYEIS